MTTGVRGACIPSPSDDNCPPSASVLSFFSSSCVKCTRRSGRRYDGYAYLHARSKVRVSCRNLSSTCRKTIISS